MIFIRIIPALEYDRLPGKWCLWVGRKTRVSGRMDHKEVHNQNSVTLHDFAKTFKVAVTPCEVFDPNVCDFTTDRHPVWHLRAVSGYPFTEEASLRHAGIKIDVMTSPEWIKLTLKGRSLGYLYSIQHPDKIFHMSKIRSRLGIAAVFPVFVREESDGLSVALQSASLRSAAEHLLQEQSASLHVQSDSVSLYVQRASVEELTKAVDLLTPLVREGRSSESEFPATVLPMKFRHFGSLIRRWVRSDDMERQRLLDQASAKDLRRLVNTVGPHLKEVDEYLDSLPDPLPEEDTDLALLAEVTVEARLRLEKDKSQKQ